MSGSLCGANCAACGMHKSCRGCRESGGAPFGRECLLARYIKQGREAELHAWKQESIAALNDLKISGMGAVEELYPLIGRFVNLEYPLPGGRVRLLDDDEIYLGNQLPAVDGRCFGVVAGEDFLLVGSYGAGGSEPELIAYRRRQGKR